MKCIRVIEYEAESERDLKKHMESTLLSHQIIVRPGDIVLGIGLVMGHPRAPQVTIRLISERFE